MNYYRVVYKEKDKPGVSTQTVEAFDPGEAKRKIEFKYPNAVALDSSRKPRDEVDIPEIEFTNYKGQINSNHETGEKITSREYAS